MRQARSPHVPALLVIADDLTGANDAGVQFANDGISSIVLVDDRASSLPTGYAVVVINTESRHVAPLEAAMRVRKAAELGLAAGVRCFYKKTDSTLRGNIGAELESLLLVTGEQFIPFVPALPELGRITRDGIHYVHGTPIAETTFAHDPLNPVRHNRVAENLSTLHGTPVSHGRSLRAASHRGIIILDCESDADLAGIARDLASAGFLRVVGGSVGLARHLPPYFALAPQRRAPVTCRGRLLLVNGSVNDRALEQISRGTADFHKIRLEPEQLFTHSTIPFSVPAEGDVLLYTVTTRSDLNAFASVARHKGVPDDQLHSLVAERTGEVVRRIIGHFGTIVVFGGDTLAGIARAAGWSAFVPLVEVEPGVSVAQPAGTDLVLISKAGGFGDRDIISRIMQFVRPGPKPGLPSCVV